MLKLFFLSLLLNTVFTVAHAKKDPRCKASNELNEHLVNPAGMKAYMQTNGIKSVDEMMCCLPESYRSNYVVAAESLAGQNSNFHSPRILLFNKLRNPGSSAGKARALESVISVNGGGKDVLQGQNIEMMYNNPQSKEVEYFDFDFAGSKPELSEKNPQLCNSCHGNSGSIGVGGAHPNFDPPFKWRRFVKGFSPCSADEKNYLIAVEQSIEKNMLSNPRFKCLNPKPDGVSPFHKDGVRPSFMIADLDTYLADLNDRRTAQIIKSSPDYKRYKFAIVGSQVCDASLMTKTLKFVPKEWLPENAIRNHDSTESLLPTIRSSNNLRASVQAEVEKIRVRNRRTFEKMRAETKAINEGKSSAFLHSEGADGCVGAGELNPANTREEQPNFANLTGDPLIDRYTVDTLARSGQSEVKLSFLRFLFEGRGFNIGDWSMQPNSNTYLRAPEKLAHFLIEKDADFSAHRSLIDKAKLATKPGEVPEMGDDASREKFCNEIKSASMKAFETGHQESEQKANRSKKTSR